MLKALPVDQLSVTIGQYSTAGRKALNQDFHGALIPEGAALSLKGIVVAIADGISSSDVSQIAAETAIKSFLTDYYCTCDAWTVKSAAQRVIQATNSWLHAETRRGRLHEDMNRGYVCTFSALVLKGRTGHLFHIGDSRVYRVSNATLELLSEDHRITFSPGESYLSRALGLAPGVEIDYREFNLQPGLTLVMTSDGVHNHIPEREIAARISTSDDLDAAAQAIVEEALARGSDDNLTIQIVRVEKLPTHQSIGAMRSADLLPPAPVPHVPSQYDGYNIVRQLHASHRSYIFLAVDMERGEKVALKVPSTDLRNDLDYLRRFAMEEWIARRINSAHVLKAAPVHRERSTLYVVTEYLEGCTLRQWMRDHPDPDLATVRAIIEQIAKGLRAFHRKDMLHQDLRPENIMVDRHGTVKIIDFGAVRVAGALEDVPELDTGDVLGTHQYAAPEYFIGQAGTELSDLYSLATIAYEMLTGQLPYGARMARAGSRSKQARVAYTPATAYRNDIPDWIDGALRVALNFDPAKRQQALSEFEHDLREPRAGLRSRGGAPIIERNPLAFWQLLSLLLALLALWLAARP